MVSVIEASFRTALMAGLGTLHRAPAGLGPAVCRAVGVAAVARRTDRKEAVAPAAGLLAKGLVHSVGVPGRPPTGRRNPNRGTTIPTGSVCRRARRSRGSGGPVRTLTYVCVHRYATRKTGSTPRQGLWTLPHLWTHTTRPQDACKTARRAVSHKRPQPILFVLIKNPEELRGPHRRDDMRPDLCTFTRPLTANAFASPKSGPVLAHLDVRGLQIPMDDPGLVVSRASQKHCVPERLSRPDYLPGSRTVWGESPLTRSRVFGTSSGTLVSEPSADGPGHAETASGLVFGEPVWCKKTA